MNRCFKNAPQADSAGHIIYEADFLSRTVILQQNSDFFNWIDKLYSNGRIYLMLISPSILGGGRMSNVRVF